MSSLPSRKPDPGVSIDDVRALALELFGTRPAVDAWMKRENPELGGQTPTQLVRAGRGEVVKDFLSSSLAGDYG